MTRILVIGYSPDAVDFSDPAIPPGLDEAKVAAGIAEDLARMRERGWDAEHLPIRADAGLRQSILDRLGHASSGGPFDCIVIGAGVRMTTKHVPELEVVLNAIHEGAPDTPIAFNASPNSSAEAAARWVGA